MACYDRRVLIPYLREVYSLELLNYDLNREIAKSQQTQQVLKETIEEWTNPPTPINYKDYKFNRSRREARNSFIRFILSGSIGTAIFIFGIKLGDYATKGGHEMNLPIMGGIMVSELAGWCLVFLVAIPAIFNFFVCLIGIGEESIRNKNDYQNDLQIYNINLAAYNKAEFERPQNKNLLIETHNKEQFLKKEKEKVELMLKDAYDANVIANQYRNIYAAYYLYTYFTTSQENDLDRIIQTFILDEIKQRLDNILHKQEELTQEIRNLINLQKAQIHQIETLRHEIMDELYSIEASQENQERYLHMIDSNVRISAYFSAINYLD